MPWRQIVIGFFLPEASSLRGRVSPCASPTKNETARQPSLTANLGKSSTESSIFLRRTCARSGKRLHIFFVQFRFLDHRLCESDNLHPMAAIWFLLFDNFKAIINPRSLEVSIPEQGMHWCFRPSEKATGKARAFGDAQEAAG